MINQQIIKAQNLKKIYRLISENPGISRVNLSKMMQISKTTASNLVDELLQSHYVVDQGIGDSNKTGRKPNELAVNCKNDRIIVVSCKKKGLKTVTIDSSFTVDHREESIFDDSTDKFLETNNEHAYLCECLVRTLQNIIDREIIGSGKRLLGICLIIPGMIDTENKQITSTVLSLSNDETIIRELRLHFSEYPISVINDTASLAYAESEFGHLESESGVYINMNEGIGAALLRKGEFFRGATGMGMQFGHVSIDPTGIACECGNRGCIEKYIGELALTRRLREISNSSIGASGKILYRDVGRMALEGSEDAIRLIDMLASEAGQVIRNMIVMFHPSMIVIGGVGVNLGKLFLEKLRKEVRKQGFRRFVQDVSISFTSLQEDSIYQGAAKYFMDMHYDFTEDMSDMIFLS